MDVVGKLVTEVGGLAGDVEKLKEEGAGVVVAGVNVVAGVEAAGAGALKVVGADAGGVLKIDVAGAGVVNILREAAGVVGCAGAVICAGAGGV